ncbi:MAG: hypothetical protein U1C47_17730 [Hydrogenophaga sp.]|uniref:hypothetical protein n=1 Tax=Hydrogenophaga sp. TaxID=1904254 RepID=UPI002735B9E5|nr:hypothetical protein [Hydrogenophaga sp.]MDP3107195.1 hypothetical protein [Hydrogenophaga sp.]MDZ4293750.1 hypothetical protein [Hydrogenophaga sp.]
MKIFHTGMEIVEIARRLDLSNMGPLTKHMSLVAADPDAVALLRSPMLPERDPENRCEDHLRQRRAARVAEMLAMVDAELANRAIEQLLKDL